MRTILAVLLLTPALALADSPPPAVTQESVEAPSALPSASMLDEVRLFNTVEVFRLDPGTVRIEMEGSTGAPNAQPTMGLRAEAGLTDHVQVSVGQEFTAPSGQSPMLYAAPLALRYSLGSSEGDVPGNPAIEAAVIPRVNAPARAALRLIAGQEVMPRVVLAVNGYLEQNLDRGTPAGVDGAFGMTGGVSYSMASGHLRLGAEAQVGEAQYGLPNYSLVASAGPNAVLHLGPFAATATVLADLARPQVHLEPMLTAGLTF